MAWPWPSSEQTDKVVPAFVAALQSVQDVARNKSAAIDTKSGGSMRYNYADLDAVLEAAKPELTAKGLAVTQPATHEGVHAVLMHSSGQWLAFPPLHVTTAQNTPQGQGSALTYARRYQMLALLNIATEDDDAKAASKPRRQESARPAQSPAQSRVQRDTGGATVTDKQHRMMMALLSGVGLKDHDEYVAYISDVIGRRIESSKEITPAEASRVIDALKGATT